MVKKKRTRVDFSATPIVQEIKPHEFSGFNEFLIIVDSNYLGYREMHGRRGKLSYGGERTGIIFGFLDTVLRLAGKFNTTRFVFAWDSRKSFRKLKYYPDYRKKREEAKRAMTSVEKAELKLAMEQFGKLRSDVLPSLGFRNVYMQTGYEGDDIIATVAMNAKGKVMIVSSDHDLYQLLNEDTSLYNPADNLITTVSKFKIDKAIDPSSWARVLAIGGCSTDEVPGVLGVGEVTAIDYLNGILPRSYKKYTSIKEGKKVISDCMKLVELPLKGTSKCKIVANDYGYEKLRRVFKEYNFRSFLREPLWGKWVDLFCADDIPF